MSSNENVAFDHYRKFTLIYCAFGKSSSLKTDMQKTVSFTILAQGPKCGTEVIHHLALYRTTISFSFLLETAHVNQAS